MRVSDRLAARLRALDCDLPPGTVLCRTHAPAGPLGAWSWFAWHPARGELGIGSHHRMTALVAADRLTVTPGPWGATIEITTD